MSPRYDEVLPPLRQAYDRAVDRRASVPVEPWKHAERRGFLDVLQREGRRSLLEVGAGTGVHGRFFADAGLRVVCTDLSGATVEHCRARGLDAYRQDVLHLDLDRTFDAVFAMNCLLHVPSADLGAAFASIRTTLVPDGLLYLGQYGGIRFDGVFEDDTYVPPRYFSWLTDEELLDVAGRHFTIESFHTVGLHSKDGSHFQSVLLRTRLP